jgi:hypothetical protein
VTASPHQQASALWDDVAALVRETNGAALDALRRAGFEKNTAPAGHNWSLVPEYYEEAGLFVATLAPPLEPDVEVAAQALQELHDLAELTDTGGPFGGDEGLINRVRLVWLAMRVGAKREVLTGTPAEQRARARKHLAIEAQRKAALSRKAERDAAAAAWLRQALIDQAGGLEHMPEFRPGKRARHAIREMAEPQLALFSRQPGWPSDDAIAAAIKIAAAPR